MNLEKVVKFFIEFSYDLNIFKMKKYQTYHKYFGMLFHLFQQTFFYTSLQSTISQKSHAPKFAFAI